MTDKYRSDMLQSSERSHGEDTVSSFDKFRGVGIDRSLYSALNVLVHFIGCEPVFAGVK